MKLIDVCSALCRQVNTKRAADWLQQKLWEDHGLRAAPIHGDLSQRLREQALEQFRKGRVRVLVATDVAARGLDVTNVAHVVNFDLPPNVDDYVHRIGRTGRAGNLGFATSFFDLVGHGSRGGGDRGLATPLLQVLRDGEQAVPEWLEAMARPRSRGRQGSGRGGRRGFSGQRGRGGGRGGGGGGRGRRG